MSYWDIVKGVGIILIVLGHSGFPVYSIQVMINYFHLSIFFFVSGALYKDKYSEDPIAFMGRKLKSIYIPTIKYAIFFILMNNILINLNIYSTQIGYEMIYPKNYITIYEMIKMVSDAILNATYAVELGGAMWMVFPLMVSIAIFATIRFSANKFKIPYNLKEYYIIICIIIFSIIGILFTIKSYKLAWRSEISMMVMVVVYAGYIYGKYKDIFKFNIVIALLSILVLFYFYNIGLEVSFAAGTIKLPVLFYIATFLGIYLILFLSKILMGYKLLSKIISLLGKNSFHIMALHFLSFKIINFLDVVANKKPVFMIAMFPYSNANLWVFNLIIGILVPVILVECKDKIKYYYKSS